ncbi:MAG: GNAT family N-acetyltransferase [Anaerolineales bacterium]|nr:GNAT family N-acetyltransferase [Anaerolineales bacterium]
MNLGTPLPEFSIQPAVLQHAAAIHQLIQEADLFQHGLDWRNFLVALTPSGEFIGCGQVKQHRDGTWELASIAVLPAWQGRGVGRAVIEALLARHPGELYLMSISALKPLYEKFGFVEIAPPRSSHSELPRNAVAQMPKYFRRLTRMPAMIAEFERVYERIMVMKREAA